MNIDLAHFDVLDELVSESLKHRADVMNRLRKDGVSNVSKKNVDGLYDILFRIKGTLDQARKEAAKPIKVEPVAPVVPNESPIIEEVAVVIPGEHSTVNEEPISENVSATPVEVEAETEAETEVETEAETSEHTSEIISKHRDYDILDESGNIDVGKLLALFDAVNDRIDKLADSRGGITLDTTTSSEDHTEDTSEEDNNNEVAEDNNNEIAEDTSEEDNNNEVAEDNSEAEDLNETEGTNGTEYNNGVEKDTPSDEADEAVAEPKEVEDNTPKKPKAVVNRRRPSIETVTGLADEALFRIYKEHGYRVSKEFAAAVNEAVPNSEIEIPKSAAIKQLKKMGLYQFNKMPRILVECIKTEEEYTHNDNGTITISDGFMTCPNTKNGKKCAHVFFNKHRTLEDRAVVKCKECGCSTTICFSGPINGYRGGIHKAIPLNT